MVMMLYNLYRMFLCVSMLNCCIFKEDYVINYLINCNELGWKWQQHSPPLICHHDFLKKTTTSVTVHTFHPYKMIIK